MIPSDTAFRIIVLLGRLCTPAIATLVLVLPLSCREADQSTNNEVVHRFTLRHFFSHDKTLDSLVDVTFDGLTTQQRAGQMIVAAAGRLGKPDGEIAQMIQGSCIGGILLLNGTADGFMHKVRYFDSLCQVSGALPLLYSADAEPSLVNRKIEGSIPVPATSMIGSDSACRQVAATIADDLLKIGIRHNYAPVVDLSQSNTAITNRSFGHNPDTVISRALSFIETMQEHGILATAKHFPGHGLVEGDTHQNLVYIDGPMREVGVYGPLIDGGVLSIMVGHIAVEHNEVYDTQGLPSTCSPAIVSRLLRDSLRFEGLIVTDAMNMGAVVKLESAAIMAIEAGCDIVLMPRDEIALCAAIVERMAGDPAFAKKVEIAVKRILRAKWCLELLKV